MQLHDVQAHSVFKRERGHGPSFLCLWKTALWLLSGMLRRTDVLAHVSDLRGLASKLCVTHLFSFFLVSHGQNPPSHFCGFV